MTLNVDAYVELDPSHDGLLLLRQETKYSADEIEVALADVPELYQRIEATIAAAAPAIWYLGSPYSHEDEGVMEARFRQVCEVAGRLFQEGAHVYSPIAHSHPIAKYAGLPDTDFETWREFDLRMLDRMRGLLVLMLPGWRESRGLAAEIGHAQGCGKPVRWVEPVLTRDRITGIRVHEQEPMRAV